MGRGGGGAGPVGGALLSDLGGVTLSWYSDLQTELINLSFHKPRIQG